jgi:hypothetical protein
MQRRVDDALDRDALARGGGGGGILRARERGDALEEVRPRVRCEPRLERRAEEAARSKRQATRRALQRAHQPLPLANLRDAEVGQPVRDAHGSHRHDVARQAGDSYLATVEARAQMLQFTRVEQLSKVGWKASHRPWPVRRRVGRVVGV